MVKTNLVRIIAPVIVAGSLTGCNTLSESMDGITTTTKDLVGSVTDSLNFWSDDTDKVQSESTTQETLPVPKAAPVSQVSEAPLQQQYKVHSFGPFEPQLQNAYVTGYSGMDLNNVRDKITDAVCGNFVHGGCQYVQSNDKMGVGFNSNLGKVFVYDPNTNTGMVANVPNGQMILGDAFPGKEFCNVKREGPMEFGVGPTNVARRTVETGDIGVTVSNAKTGTLGCFDTKTGEVRKENLLADNS